MSKYTNLTPIWDSLPISITWQMFHRDNDDFSVWEAKIQNVREGINISIIMNTASMIEGYLEEKLSSVLISHLDQGSHTELDKRILNKFIVDLSNYTFSKYEEFDKIILGKKIVDLLGSENSELWKDVKYLFIVRNIVAHSQSLQTEIDMKAGSKTAAGFEFIGKFKKIQDYFIERSINTNTFPEGTNFKSMIFNDGVANYFFNKGKMFIECVDVKLKEIGIQEKYNLKSIFRNYTR